jgi:hypothetical protein
VDSIQGELPESQQQAAEIFRSHGGMLRTMQAVRLGVHPRTLYAMRDNGTLEQLSRGLYRLAELAPLSAPDLVAVAKLVPSAVICLISALSLHELTTEIPHEIHVALARGAATPRVEHPPLRVFRFSEAALAEALKSTLWMGASFGFIAPRRRSRTASSFGTSWASMSHSTDSSDTWKAGAAASTN